MSNYTLEQIKTQRVERQSVRAASATKWRQVKVYQHNTQPSWKRFGKGVASLDVQAVINNEGIPVISITASETAIANAALDEKRDVTKEAYFTAYGEAALEIYEVLREAFEPKVDDPR